MAVILGFLAAAAGIPSAANPHIAPEISAYDVDYWPPHGSTLGATPHGARVDEYPVAAITRALTGQIVHAYSDDYYHRIHVLPRAIDLGNLLEPESHPVEVWNAHLTNKTLTAIAAVGDDGLTLGGHAAPPLAYTPLQSRLYTLDASPVGPPVIDATYAFDFGAEELTLDVVGRRVIIFAHRPNWAEPFSERLEWKTEVLSSYDGSEQRIALRAAPRRRYEYTLLAHGLDAMVLDTQLFGWGARTFALPVWTDQTRSPTQINSGTTTLSIPDLATQDWRADGLAVLWHPDAEAAAAEVGSLGSGTITLKQPLAATWPAGTKIFPARLARLEGAPKLTHPTDALSIARLAWLIEDTDAPTATGYGATYRSVRVFDLAPNRAEDLDSTWTRKLAELDWGGLPSYDDESGAPIVQRRLTYLLRSRTEIAAIRAWAAERRGRYQPCWLPSWQSDLKVTQAIGGGDNTITIANIGLARLIGLNARRKDIAIRAGSLVYYRRLTAVTQIDADEEVLGIDTSLGTSYAPEQISAVNWLWFARLDTDAIELAWETDGIAHCALPFRLLPAP